MSKYEGKENLDIMSLAKNYNNSIYSWIINNENIENKNILDFGSGKGEFCNRFNKNIYAVELDSSMHKFLNCPSRDNIFKFNKKFNLIYSSNVLEHIKNDTNSIKDIYNSLDKGGIVKILVPARMEIYTNMDKSVGHYRRYTKQELIKKFTQNGFKITYCKYFDFIGYFATLAYKLLDNSSEISPNSLKLYDKYVFPVSKFIDKITFGSIIGKNIILRAIKDE